jgi:hypothetical protein
MEYKNKLDHLNLAELAGVLNVDMELLLNSITQKKEIHIKDIPIIVTYGDLCIIQRALFDAQKALLGLLQGKEDAIKKANGASDELHKLFEYVDKVLMDGNISKEIIHKLDPAIEIPN